MTRSHAFSRALRRLHVATGQLQSSRSSLLPAKCVGPGMNCWRKLSPIRSQNMLWSAQLPLFIGAVWSPDQSKKKLFRLLIGSLYCLCPLWLAEVFTLVLVLRHSIENRSNVNKTHPRSYRVVRWETLGTRLQATFFFQVIRCDIVICLVRLTDIFFFSQKTEMQDVPMNLISNATLQQMENNSQHNYLFSWGSCFFRVAVFSIFLLFCGCAGPEENEKET